MKLSKELLIQTIDQWVKDRKEQTERYQQAKKDYQEGYNKGWFKFEGRALLELSKMITAKIDSQKVVTNEDVRTLVRKYLPGKLYPGIGDLLYSHPSYTTLTVGQVLPNPEVTTKILALKDVLEMVTDDYISSSSLERMGFRDIQFLFKSAYESQKKEK